MAEVISVLIAIPLFIGLVLGVGWLYSGGYPIGWKKSDEVKLVREKSERFSDEYVKYWVDKNNNKWSTFYSKKEAIKYSRTLTRCYNCYDCQMCYDCTDCIGCTSCGGCIGCSGCKHCRNCKNCTDCTDCTECTDCTLLSQRDLEFNTKYNWHAKKTRWWG